MEKCAFGLWVVGLTRSRCEFCSLGFSAFLRRGSHISSCFCFCFFVLLLASRNTGPNKSILLKPLHLDPIALQILARTRNRGDQAILSGVMAHFEAEGIGIVPQSRYLVASIPKEGLLAKRKPTTAEWEDIRYGLEIARSIADLDIGQTVVLKDGIILSVEATEGTDQTIRRAGDLASKGMTVVKTAATHHDFRIDTPTIGSHTLEAMRAAEASVLAVEAERVLLIRPQELAQLANQYRISIVIVEPQKVG